MLSHDFYYSFCPDYRKMVDLYFQIQSKVISFKMHDEIFFGELSSDEYYYDKVESEIKEFMDLFNSFNIEDCVNKVNIFKSFELYDFW